MNRFFRHIAATALGVCLGVSLTGAALAVQGERTEEHPVQGVLSYVTVVTPQYEAAAPFSEGMAAVRQNGKWGYVDEGGALVIPCQYDRAYRFSEGFAIVGTVTDSLEDVDTGAWYDLCEMGFVDREGVYTPFIYPYAGFDAGARADIPGPLLLMLDRAEGDGARRFYGGCFAGEELLYDTQGNALPQVRANGWQATEGLAACDSFYTVLSTGKTVGVTPPAGWRLSALRPFNQGLAPAGVSRERDGETEALWGFVDRTGAWVVAPQYLSFMVGDAGGAYEVFGETGLAMVQSTNGKWGAIDKTGAVVIPFAYDALRPYSEGLALFCLDGKYGFLDETGAVAIPAQYTRAGSFGGSGYAAVYDGGQAALIDRTGQRLSGLSGLSASVYLPTDGIGPGAEEYVLLEQYGKYGFARVSFLPALPGSEEMDSWAYDEAVQAIQEGLVPISLQNLYRQDITRAEFCSLVLQALEVLGKGAEETVLERTGKTLEDFRREYPFLDTNSAGVAAAYALGIVDGRGKGVFDPYAPITRQEAAALLARTASVAGLETDGAEDAGFTDSGEIGKWFVDAVNFVAQTGIMNGTGGGRFSPGLGYTREQAYVTVYRLFQTVQAPPAAAGDETEPEKGE